MMNTLLEEARTLAPGLKALKDDLHRHPEPSMGEIRTTAIIRNRLAELGIPLVDLGMESGAVGLLRGGLPGPTVLLRADIDAIRQETPEVGEVVSQVPGLMHACGHDFHTACLLGAAALLERRRENLPGNAVFLFQPGEETAQGAVAMVKNGLWEKLPITPDWVFGLHNRPEIPAGKIAVVPGPLMAGKSNFEIVLHGVTGHGGSPHKCVDVIVAAAAVIDGIQTIVSRNSDPQEPLVCAVCSIHGGSAENFAPDLLTMTGSIRALSDTARHLAERRVRELAERTAAAYNCTADVTVHQVAPLLLNGPEATALAVRAASSLVGEDHLVCPRPDLGSEDFGVYGEKAPAFFYWLGSGFPDRENAGWHSDRFRTDDSALPLGAALLAQSVLTGLGL